MKTKLQKTQNKCTHFCLSLPPRSCSNPLHFRKINWFREDNRVEYCIENTVFKYWNELVPEYIHSTRSQMALSITLWKTNTEEKSFILLRAKNMIKNHDINNSLFYAWFIEKCFTLVENKLSQKIAPFFNSIIATEFF